MYKVLVVDDEAEIREGVIQRMPWQSLGFEVVGSAENGVVGLEMAESLHPDLILTDIKMDFMDGLTMCRRIRENNLSTRFIILTGFDDFEYAKQAIRLDVIEYLMKPISANELTESLARAKEQLDAARLNHGDLAQLRERYQENLPIVRENYLLNLINGRNISNPRRMAERLELPLAACKFWFAAILQPTEHRAEEIAEETELEQLLPFQLKQVCEAQSIGAGVFSVLNFNRGLAFICGLDAASDQSEWVRGFGAVCALIRSVLGFEVTVGIGSVVDEIAEVSQSFRQARTAFDYRGLLSEKRTVLISDLEPLAGQRAQITESELLSLEQAVRSADEQVVAETVSHIFATLSQQLSPLSEQRLIALRLVSSLIPLSQSCEIAPELVFGQDLDSLTGMMHLTQLDDLHDACQGIATRLVTELQRQRVSSAAKLALEARAYIDSHYHDSTLSVEEVCSHLHISQAYFSQIFKKECGQTFVSYLTEVRMKEATRLISESSLKTYQVATACGFSDPNYFSYVFKKYYGCSPTLWRQKLRPEV